MRTFPLANYASTAALMLVCCATTFGQLAAAQGDLSDEPLSITREQAANPPERQLEFQESDEPFTALPRLDAELLERKYVASFELKPPPPFDISSAHPQLLKIVESERLGDGYLYRLNLPGQVERPSMLRKAFKQRLEEIPENRRPPADALTFLDSDHPEIQTKVIKTDIDGQSVVRRSFTIYANSPDDAKRFTKALLTVMDEGVSRPIQLGLFDLRDEHKSRAERTATFLKEPQAELRELEAQAEKVADFPSELLPALRVQQLELEVEEAGIKRRLASYDKLLEGGGLTAEQTNRFSELKTIASVDLASNEARQRKIEEFVGNVKRRINLEGKIAERRKAIRPYENGIQSATNEIRLTEEFIKTYQPLEVDGKVTIRPLVWAK